MSINGHLLKKLRKEKDPSYTQEYMAKLFGVSVGAWRNWEQSINSPDTIMLARIADYFDVSVDLLLGRSEKPTAVPPAIDNRPDRRYLMDKIAKATPDQLEKLDKLWSIISDEDEHNNY